MPRRIGVVGLGVIAKFYLAAIDRLPDWELAAVCDVREEALHPYRDRVACYSEHESLLREAELDAVIVTVPNDSHGEVCGKALHAGVPVCVEKPLALSASEGQELDRLARKRQVPLFTAFHRRYNENMRSLREKVRPHTVTSMTVRYLELIEDHIGQDTWYLDPGRCGGGCVADNGPNAFDLVRRFLGQVAVIDSSTTRDATGTDRQAKVRLRNAAGSTATVELDWSFPGEVKDVEVVLADGSVLREDMLAGHHGFKSSLWHEYTGVLNDFAATITSGESGANDGLDALELVAASYALERTSSSTQEKP